MCIDKVGDYGFLPTIPEYETVAEWEKRRGEEYPYTAPVYARFKSGGEPPEPNYECRSYGTYQRLMGIKPERLIVATEAGAPPDDWRPE
jgi:hypothetical protein